MSFIQKLKKSEAGFTLMEVLLGMVLFSMLSVSIGTLLANTLNTNKRLTEKSMKLEDARIAMDFIQTHIETAYGLNIYSDVANPIKLTTNDGEKDLHGNVKIVSTFKFEDNKIKFGDNVLAQDVKNFEVYRDTVITSPKYNMVKITIEMKATGYDILKLVGEVNVKYK